MTPRRKHHKQDKSGASDRSGAGDGAHSGKRIEETEIARAEDLWLPIVSKDNNEALSDRGDDQAVSTYEPILHPDNFPADQLPNEALSEANNLKRALGPPSRSAGFRYRLSMALDGVLDGAKVAFRQESERGAALLWMPVLMGLGVVIYFNLQREPVPFAFGIVMVVALWLRRWLAGEAAQSTHRTVIPTLARTGLLIVAGLSVGVTVAQLHTQWRATPSIGTGVTERLAGTVLKAEHRANKSVRYTVNLNAKSIGTLFQKAHARFEPKGAMPKNFRVRISARHHKRHANIGDTIEGLARIGPPGGAVYPGSYDFGFAAWYEGIGASGFFLGAPSVVDRPATNTHPVPVRLTLAVAGLRANVAQILRENLPGRTGALAAALIVGDRSGIDEDTQKALRVSGLAHILAISGLHMGLVAATIMVSARAVFAAFPFIVLRYPARKWAASAALFGSTVYLFLSGSSISAERAYIMIAVMLLAIVLDRRALTMRNVALAGIIIILLSPQAVLGPGFQMSFAAVAALVATYEVGKKRRWLRTDHDAKIPGKVPHAVSSAWRGVLGLALTSLVAGLATALFAAYHFHHVASLGLVGNLLAMPLVTMAVMPLAVLAMIAMPFGLEGLPLWAMGQMVDHVVDIASWVASLSGPTKTGALSQLAFALGVLALMIATLSRTALKWASVPVGAAAALALFVRPSPEVLILENARQVGLFDQQGKLHLLRPTSDKFSTQIWRDAYESGAPLAASFGTVRKRGAKGPMFACDAFGCSAQTELGYRITVLESTARLHEDCLMADVLVIPYDAAEACDHLDRAVRPLVYDRSKLRRLGSVAIAGLGPPRLAAGIENSPSSENAKRLAALRPIWSVTHARPAKPRPWTDHLWLSEKQPVFEPKEPDKELTEQRVQQEAAEQGQTIPNTTLTDPAPADADR